MSSRFMTFLWMLSAFSRAFRRVLVLKVFVVVGSSLGNFRFILVCSTWLSGKSDELDNEFAKSDVELCWTIFLNFFGFLTLVFKDPKVFVGNSGSLIVDKMS